MKTHTKEFQQNLTPDQALDVLKEGNKRFVNSLKMQRNLLDLVQETSDGQYPFAAVLSCIDSRVPAEVVFDQGIGDLFSVRVAGNIVNEDILGSIEYACGVAGSKIVVVMGHTKCGAVTAACQKVEMGNITALLSKIKPAISAVETKKGSAEVEEVAIANIEHSIEEIKAKSIILSDLEKEGKIKISSRKFSHFGDLVEFL